MFTRGEFTTDNVTYGALMKHTKSFIEILLVTSGTVVSAYKADETGAYSYNNTRAKELAKLILDGTKKCTSKNCVPMPFELGAMNQHEFVKARVEYIMQMFKGEVVGAYVQSEKVRVEMSYVDNITFPEIPYVKLTTVRKASEIAEDELDTIQTRSVEEIALEKEDITWLQRKNYYIVNDDETAERLFTFLDNYNGPIAYDTETTGLKINCFGQINSKYQHSLEEYNKEHSDNPIRADKLVGIIFCVEEDTSYYFPCFNRKFKNLYEESESPIRKSIIQKTKAEYTVGSMRDHTDCVAEYWRKTPENEITSDCILMARVRKILETKHIVAHNGSFEWKVGQQYCIDTNLKDDTMIMHQVVYKFRSGTGKAEPSNLKYLAKRELGVDQWELHDFFPNWKPDKDGLVRRKPGSKFNPANQIDFSYMDYQGTRVYAPTDGDVTLGLYHKYKRDMLDNHKEMEYIYNVEIIVACAIGYMEFYGHKIDESKIMHARAVTMANKAQLISEIRQSINYSDADELEAYRAIKEFRDTESESNLTEQEFGDKLLELVGNLEGAIENNTEKQILLSSPAQVADLFYNKLGYPQQGDKPSVAKKEIKALLKEKNDDGSPRCPVAHLYSKYKSEDTLLTKFFDNLIYFTYPGGFIFSSYGQIATNTGRMSCIDEDALISVVGGYKKIKDIEVGDMVYCYDNDGNIAIRKVLNKLDKGIKDCIELTWQSQGTHEFGNLVCTPDHKILSKDNGWVRADRVSLCYNHKIVDKRSVGKRHVYDLEVEEFHNFIANEICVHNCSKPNAQQYPKVITKIIVPRDGYAMMDADYSQIEYRVLTAMAGNEWLAELFSNPDSDYHTLMASLMYDVDYSAVTSSMRSAAKSFNFGIPYGMGFGSLAILLTGKNTPQTRDEAKEKYEDYFKNQPKTRKFFDNVKEMAQVNGYTKTLFNRYRYYSFTDKDGNVNNAKKAAALRQAGNAVIQGCIHGDTKIETKEFGIKPIKELVGYSGLVWNGTDWTHGDVLYSGKKQKCIITFTNGQKFICSPIHRFQIVRETYHAYPEINPHWEDDIRRDGYIGGGFVRCKDLQVGQAIYINEQSHLIIKDYVNKVHTLNCIGYSDDGLNIEYDYKSDMPCVIVESVEITDEYIDMYDVCNTDCGYYVADGIITHNTAADIFKIGVARNFSFIRRNKLLGKLLIINMIHDEQLMEVDVQNLNMQRIVAEVGNNMQFHIDGFPPLYIGAGIGKAWGYAKGKAAEIHPDLLAQFTEEAKSIPIFRTQEQIDAEPYVDPVKVVEYFDNRVVEFRRKKVADYLSNPDNWHKTIYPAISGLINLQFNYGRGDDAKAYVGPNGETYSDQEFLELNIADFLKENNIQAEASWFKAGDNKAEDEEEDSEYDENIDEDDLLDTVEGDEDDRQFTLVDESDKTFGSSVHDMINIFGSCILKQHKICGINTKDMYYKKKDALIDYLMGYICDKSEPDALQIVFLTDANILKYTGIYVKDLDPDKLEKAYKNVGKSETDFTQGDVKNRSQAK